MALTDDAPTAVTILCDNCDSEDAAQSRCNECGVFLCQFCTESHKRYRSTKHHELLSMKQLKSNPTPQTIAEKMRCSKHKEEMIKLFCKTCQTTICRDCTIVDHQGHKYEFVEEVAVHEKQKIIEDLNKVKERKTRVVEGIANLTKFNNSLEAKKKSMISEIHQHFDELAKATEYRKQEMVEKVTSLTNSKQKQVSAQFSVLQIALACCESSIEFTEQAFKNGNDVQILSMEKYILKSLEELKTVYDQTEPCVVQDMVFIVPSSVQETRKTLLTKYDIHVPVANPENCKALFKGDETVLGGGNKYSITLICNDTNNRRMRHGGQVIKPSFLGVKVRDIAVTDNKDGSYEISFCPDQCGMLSFEVFINGTRAPQCSLTKQVKWIISDLYGSGYITNGGNTMSGVGSVGQYCCRVGWCSFESGVHTWKVRLRYKDRNVDYCDDYMKDDDYDDAYHEYGDLYDKYGNAYDEYKDDYDNYGNAYDEYGDGYCNAICEVGIIDCGEIADIANSKKKWVYRPSFGYHNFTKTVSLTLDMDRKTLNTRSNNCVKNYQFTAPRVMPFFSSNSHLV